jgi:hypothetical protein
MVDDIRRGELACAVAEDSCAAGAEVFDLLSAT